MLVKRPEGDVNVQNTDGLDEYELQLLADDVRYPYGYYVKSVMVLLFIGLMMIGMTVTATVAEGATTTLIVMCICVTVGVCGLACYFGCLGVACWYRLRYAWPAKNITFSPAVS